MEGESADVEDNPRSRDLLQMESAKSMYNETRVLGNEMQSKRALIINCIDS